MTLEGFSKAVPQGKVVVQFSYPYDEVGNQVLDPVYVQEEGGTNFTHADIPEDMLKHPVTKIDYGAYYIDIIEKQGAQAEIIYANDPLAVLGENPKGVIAADIRTRHKTKAKLMSAFPNCITLQELCSEGEVASEWGLLGSNMSSAGKLKLLPRSGDQVAQDIQTEVLKRTGVKVEVLIYGDGAFKDPETGIYELADPVATFGSTSELNNCVRGGVKYKMLADKLYAEGKGPKEIEAAIQVAQTEELQADSIGTEGTTPRNMKDILASLADLVSGSSDAGTPVVLIKNIYRPS